MHFIVQIYMPRPVRVATAAITFCQRTAILRIRAVIHAMATIHLLKVGWMGSDGLHNSARHS